MSVLNIKSVRWKNFLATGNAWTEIKMNQPLTSISGKNGTGKCLRVASSVISVTSENKDLLDALQVFKAKIGNAELPPNQD